MQLVATIKEVQWREENTGFTIALCQAEGREFRLVANLARATDGQHLMLEGGFTDHELYGHCFLASQATMSDDEERLLDLGVDSVSRDALLSEDGTLDPELDPFEADVDPAVANRVAVDLGVGAPARIRRFIQRLLEQRHDGIADDWIIRRVAEVMQLPTAQVHMVLEAGYNEKEWARTTTGFVVSVPIIERAQRMREWVQSLPADHNFVDDLQWDQMVANVLPASLTESERQAVHFALNHRVCIIDLSQWDRATLLEQAIVGCLDFMGCEERLGFKYANAPGEELDRVVYFMDSRRTYANSPAMNGIFQSRRLPFFVCTPHLSTPLDNFMYTVASAGRRLQLTSITNEEGQRFSADMNGDESVHAITLTPIEMVNEVVRLQMELDAEGCQVVSTGMEGDLGVVNLTAAIRSQAVRGVPLAGPFAPGDKILTSPAHWDIARSTEQIREDTTFSWVLTPAQLAFFGEGEWDTIILCVDERHTDGNWRVAYDAAVRAGSRLVIIGRHSAIKRLRSRAPKVRRDEALYAALKREGDGADARGQGQRKEVVG